MTDEEFYAKLAEVLSRMKEYKREGNGEKYIEQLKLIATELKIQITSRKYNNMCFVIDCRFEGNIFGI